MTLFLGLFSSRWILAALGQTDFGLYGVVGSAIFFVTFLNTVLSSSMTRFYAYSIGAGKNMSDVEAKEDLMRWFNTALSIHVCLPIALISIGYPICAYALDHWLVIPADRMSTCLWVLRLSFVCAFVSMVTAPYVAMFTAFQFITELVVFNLIQAFALFGCACVLEYCPGDRLLWYAAFVSGIQCLNLLGLTVRARALFAPCQISLSRMFDALRLRRVLSYSGMKAIGGIAWVLRCNGSAMLLNVYLGPRANAAFSISQQLSGQAAAFSGHLINALSPAVTTAEGAGAHEAMRVMAFRCCKFGTLLVLLFGIPLAFEMDYFLSVWLKTIPECAAPLCIAMIVTFVLDYLTNGHQIAISARGQITSWQTYDAIAYMMTLPIGWMFVKFGCGVPAIGYAYMTTVGLISAGRLYFARRLVGMGIRLWARQVFFPLLAVIIASSLMAWGVMHLMATSFLRLCTVTGSTSLVILAIGWFLALDGHERDYVAEKINRVMRQIRRGD